MRKAQAKDPLSRNYDNIVSDRRAKERAPQDGFTNFGNTESLSLTTRQSVHDHDSVIPRVARRLRLASILSFLLSLRQNFTSSRRYHGLQIVVWWNCCYLSLSTSTLLRGETNSSGFVKWDVAKDGESLACSFAFKKTAIEIENSPDIGFHGEVESFL
jgi:hypothetical protein